MTKILSIPQNSAVISFLNFFFFFSQAEGPEEAPQTIVGREELLRMTKENYFYSPGMGEVPEIAVPDFLPDLLGKTRLDFCSLLCGIITAVTLSSKSCNYHIIKSAFVLIGIPGLV